MRRLGSLVCFAVLGATVVASASFLRPPPPPERDAVQSGRRIFEQRCALCHSTGEHAAQGPGLGGVLGRKSGVDALRLLARSARGAPHVGPRDARSLPRRPGAAGPGHDDARWRSRTTSSVAPHRLPGDTRCRRHVVPCGGVARVHRLPRRPGLRTGHAAFGDYRGDGPGVRRHITTADLPAPYATPSAQNGPNVVAPPPGAHPYVPPGFRVDVFAHDLVGPRLLRVSPSGDLFVAESQAGRVRVLRAADGARAVEKDSIFASGLERPFGITFYPPGPDPKWVYVAETNAVVRFPYANGDMTARGGAQTLVPSLTDGQGGHWTRDVAFSARRQADVRLRRLRIQRGRGRLRRARPRGRAGVRSRRPGAGRSSRAASATAWASPCTR
jgi:hypothetical protein